MPRPLSNDLRFRIVAAYRRLDTTFDEVGRIFAVSKPTVWRLVQAADRNNLIEPKPHGGGRARAIPKDKESRLDDLVRSMPDATVTDLARAYTRKWKAKISRSAMYRALRRQGFTSKKKPKSKRAAESRRSEDKTRIRRAASWSSSRRSCLS